MPIAPYIPLIGAGINAATQLIQNGSNIRAQREINQQTLNYQQGFNAQQREWALQDWNMQNEYNTPAEQRKRMISANMNPALMYGSGATNTPSATVRSTGSSNWSPQAPQSRLNPAETMMTYIGIQKQQAELHQMELQNNLLEEKYKTQVGITRLTWNKSALTQAQNDQIQSWLDGIKQFDDLGLGTNVSGDQLGYQATKLYNDTNIQSTIWSNMLQENDRKNLLNAANIDEITERLKLIAQQRATTEAQKRQIEENIKLLKQSGILKGIEIDGQQLLNGRFDSPATKIAMALLNKALSGK